MNSGWVTDSATAWADLRATRHAPPGYAAKGGRREVYVAAMEQAEQLFAAAAHVGHATRPLLLFYGLSQAGRALAAAAPAPRGTGWKLTSHGLKAPRLDEPLTDVPVIQVGKAGGSFTRLSALLNSAPIPSDPARATTLGDLWEFIPEAQSRPLREHRVAAPLLPFLRDAWKGSEEEGVVGAILTGVPNSITDLVTPGKTLEQLQGLEPIPAVAALDSFMTDYPHAAGYTSVDFRSTANSFVFRSLGDRGAVRLEWLTGGASADAQAVKIAEVATLYRDQTYLMPALRGSDRPLHPLMVWWCRRFVKTDPQAVSEN